VVAVPIGVLTNAASDALGGGATQINGVVIRALQTAHRVTVVATRGIRMINPTPRSRLTEEHAGESRSRVVIND